MSLNFNTVNTLNIPPRAQQEKLPTKSMILISLILGVFISGFVFTYVGNEHPAYIWDWGNYFEMYQYYGNLAHENTYTAIKSIFLAIRSADYNPSSIVALIPINILLSNERAIYILGIVTLYLLPSSIIIFNLVLNSYTRKTYLETKYIILVFILMFPPFWQVSLRGLPDIIGIIPLGSAALITVKSNYLSNKTIKHSIAIGSLIWMAFLFRRWYAYSGAALLILILSINVIRNFSATWSLSNLLRAVTPTTIAGSTILLLVLLFQYDLMLRVLMTSYKDIYQAYQAPLSEHVIRLYSHSGPVFFTLTMVGIILAIYNRNHHVVFFSLVAITSFLLFSTTQAPGVQHGLPVYLFLFPAASLPLIYCTTSLSKLPRLTFSLIIILIFFGIYLFSFSPTYYKKLTYLENISPKNTYHPLRLNNYSEYQRLISDLHKNLGKDDKFSVFSSSEILSDALIHSLDKTLDSKIAWVGHIDEVDGFRIATVKSRYAIVVDPTPIHEAISSQQVIIIPAKMIKNHEGIGDDYHQALGPYKLDNEHTAYVYERYQPLSNEKIHLLESALKQSHPQWVWNGADRIYTP